MKEEENCIGKGSVNGSALPSTINLYPIPFDQLVMNPNLKQNPGY